MVDEPPPQPSANGDRLESWKDIAAYLRRDVRTVQRWEQTDGLPVHRHKRAHRPIPYAWKTELDAWWTSRSKDHAGAIEQDGSPAAVGPRRFATASLAALVVIALTAGAYWILRARSVHATTERAPAPLVTTSSKTALLLFTEANRILEENGDNRSAEMLLRDAIAADSRFASAHIWLAWALLREGRSSSDYLPFAARAEQLADAASESERFFIRGSALAMQNHPEEACPAWEAVLRVQRDHYWATNNLMRCYSDEGDQVAMADMAGKLADLRPDGIDENVRAAWANEFMVGNSLKAQKYLRRAQQLQLGGKYSRANVSDPWLRLRPAYKKWLADDVDGALADLTETLRRDGGQLDAYRTEDLNLLAGYFMVTLGRLRDAERLFSEMPNKGGQPGQVALVAYAHDDIERARRLEVDYLGMGIRSAMICARIGLPEQARHYIQQHPRQGSQAEALEGELALHSGDITRAVEHLSAAVRAFRLTTYGGGEEFMAAEALALALASSNRLDEALGVLEAAAVTRQHAYDPFASGPLSGYCWLRVRVLEAELYARGARKTDSERAAREIVKLLAKADSDFPILQRAKQLLNQ
jgi:tetratricopeptide (TPR) repeat protein